MTETVTNALMIAFLVCMAGLVGFAAGMHIALALHGILIPCGLVVTTHPFEKEDPLFLEELPF